MIKAIGILIVLFCGVTYAVTEQKNVLLELKEAEWLLEIFTCVKNEIAEFDAPINGVLKRKGIGGGIEGLLSKISSENLREVLKEAEKLGRGYKKEELRACERILGLLAEKKRRLEEKAKETKALSRVKGIGVAVAVIILFL